MTPIEDRELFEVVKNSNFCLDFVNNCFKANNRDLKYKLTQILKESSNSIKKVQLTQFIASNKNEVIGVKYFACKKWAETEYYKKSISLEDTILKLSEELKKSIVELEYSYLTYFPEEFKNCFCRSIMTELVGIDCISFDTYFTNYEEVKKDSLYLKNLIEKIEVLSKYSLIKEAEAEYKRLFKPKAELKSYKWIDNKNHISLHEFCKRLKSCCRVETKLVDIKKCFQNKPISNIHLPIRVLKTKLNDPDLIYLIRYVLMKDGYIETEDNWELFISIFRNDMNKKSLQVLYSKLNNPEYTLKERNKVRRLVRLQSDN